MRLIDADALTDELVAIQGATYMSTCTSVDECNGKRWMIARAIDAVKDTPEIDAVPVVRGEWVEAKSGVMSVWPPGQVMCSVCGQRMPSQWKKMPPYCYGCGAKMEDKPCG